MICNFCLLRQANKISGFANILLCNISNLCIFSVSARQPPDAHGPEAGEHPVRVHGLVHRGLPGHQAPGPAHARHPRQADRLRVGNLRLGAPQQRGVNPALPAPGGDPGAGLEPALRRVEHRLHSLRAVPGKLHTQRT